MPSKTSPINTADFRFDIAQPKQLRRHDWQAIYGLMQTAFRHSLPDARSDSAVKHVVGGGSLNRFAFNRLFPSLAAGYEKQLFAQRRVVRAFDANDVLAGYLYTADNTSGNMVARTAKMAVLPGREFSVRGRELGGKRYATIREVAVDPAYQHRGLGHVMGYLALHERPDSQPVSAYIWPTELPQMAESLTAIGMYYAGEDAAHDPGVAIYGETAPRVRQERWLGEVATVRGNILDMPNASAAVSQALVDIHS